MHAFEQGLLWSLRETIRKTANLSQQGVGSLAPLKNKWLRSALLWWRRRRSCPDGPPHRVRAGGPTSGASSPGHHLHRRQHRHRPWGVLLLPVEHRASFSTPQRSLLSTSSRSRPPSVRTPPSVRCSSSWGTTRGSASWTRTSASPSDPLLDALWFRPACRQAFEWWERVSSTSVARVGPGSGKGSRPPKHTSGATTRVPGSGQGPKGRGRHTGVTTSA